MWKGERDGGWHAAKGSGSESNAAPLQDSAYMGQTLLLGELEAAPAERLFIVDTFILVFKAFILKIH